MFEHKKVSKLILGLLTVCLSTLVYCEGSQGSNKTISCETIFPNSKNSLSQDRILFPLEIDSLDNLAEALSKGVSLHKESHKALFDLYLATYFGKHNIHSRKKSFDDILRYKRQYPELKKREFREYQVNLKYNPPKPPKDLVSYFDHLTKVLKRTANGLYHPLTEIGMWKKMLGYAPQANPFPVQIKEVFDNVNGAAKETVRTQIEELRNKSKLFDLEQNRLFMEFFYKNAFSQADLELLEAKEYSYKKKAELIFKVLTALHSSSKDEPEKTKIQENIALLLLSLEVFNPSMVIQTKEVSSKLLTLAFEKVLKESKKFAKGLNIEGGIFGLLDQYQITQVPGFFDQKEIIEKLKLEFPRTNLEKVSFKEKMDKISKIFSTSMEFSEENNSFSESYRVRPLSLEESAFRSCLGESDCSTATYFSAAFDPNFHYFTITGGDNKSSGHATIVLGTASSQASPIKISKQLNIAFLDKLQNVDLNKIPFFLEAVSKSLKESGYTLAIPISKGFHSGISNQPQVDDFIYNIVTPKLKQKAYKFKPHPNSYRFEKLYSRSDSQLDVYIYRENNFDENFEFLPGPIYIHQKLDQEINIEDLANKFLALKDSKNTKELSRFVLSYNLIPPLAKYTDYSLSSYFTDVVRIFMAEDTPARVKKDIFITSLITDLNQYPDLNFNDLPDNLKMELLGEIGQWNRSSSATLKEIHEIVFKLRQSNSKLGEVQRFLIDRKSDIFLVADDFWGTVLHKVIFQSDDLDTIFKLLNFYKSQKSLLLSLDRDGNSLLNIGLLKAKNAPDLADYLIDIFQEYPNIFFHKNKGESNILMEALRLNIPEPQIEKIFHMYKQNPIHLLELGVGDTNIVQKAMGSDISTKLKLEFLDLLNTLPDLLSIKDSKGDNILLSTIHATKEFDLLEKCISIYLKHPREIVHRNTFGVNALHIALRFGLPLDLIEPMIESIASTDPNLLLFESRVSGEIENYLSFAIQEMKSLDTIKYLIEVYARYPVLLNASESPNGISLFTALNSSKLPPRILKDIWDIYLKNPEVLEQVLGLRRFILGLNEKDASASATKNKIIKELKKLSSLQR